MRRTILLLGAERLLSFLPAALLPDWFLSLHVYV